jgi:anti-sigma factor RsiW
MCSGHINGDDLDEYLLGRIEDEERLRAIEEHLLICPYCQEHVEDHDALLDALRKANPDESTS